MKKQTTKKVRHAVPTAAGLAAQAPQGWTATHGTGFAFSWEQGEDDWFNKREAVPQGEWVRFAYTDGDLHCVIALNVSKVAPTKYNKWERDRMWHGRKVEGHTMYNGRSFTRRGIDCESCKLTDLKSEREFGHTYGDLEALLTGELQRCREAHDRSKTMVEVPGLPGGWKVTPTRKEAISLSLRGGGKAEFTPHGMGTGYVVSAKRPRGWGHPLPAATSAFFGVTGPLFYETTDCD